MSRFCFFGSGGGDEERALFIWTFEVFWDLAGGAEGGAAAAAAFRFLGGIAMMRKGVAAC
jgi:hypothetical protein